MMFRCFVRQFLGLIACFLFASLCAQNTTIVIGGSVVSENKEPLAGATVILLSKVDSAFIGYEITGEKGDFRFEKARQPTGGWVLKARSIGYSAAFLAVEEPSQEIRLSLKSVGEQLQEITVAEKLPIKARKDTVLYRGEAFRDSTERKVSELLRKLPGVEVNDVGDVEVNGQAIRTVLIDGDNLLDNNYQVLTNNLNADIVEDVEIIFNYLDNPLLATVFEGRDIAVNLRTVASKRRQINGSLSGGVGTSGRYEMDVNVVGLYERLKVVSFFQRGNLGRAIPRISYNPLPVSDFALQSLSQPGNERLEQINMPSSSNPTRLNTANFLSSVAHYTPGKNWRIRASIVMPLDDYELLNTTFYDYAGDSTDQQRSLRTTGTQRLTNYSFALRKEVPGRTRYEMKATLLGTRQEQETNFDNGENYENNVQYQGLGLRATMTRKLGVHTLGVLDLAFQDAKETMNQDLVDTVRGVLLWPDSTRVNVLQQQQVYQPQSLYLSGKLLGQAGATRFVFTTGYCQSISQFNFVQTRTDFELLNRDELFVSGQLRQKVGNDFNARVSLKAGMTDVSGLGEINTRLPYLTFFATLEKEWNIMKYLRASFLNGRSLPEELKSVTSPRYRTRYLIVSGNPQLIGTLNTSRRLSAEFATGNILPHRSLTVRASVDRGEQGYLPDYRVIGNTTVASWSIGERSRNAYAVGARGEYFVGAISSTVKLKGDYRTDRYQTLLTSELNNLEVNTLSWMASLKTGVDIPINLAAGVEQIRTKLTPENSGTFTSIRTLPYLDLILISGSKLSARWSNNWQLLRAGEQVNQSLIADVELGYRLPGKVSRLGLHLYNTFNSKNISNTQVYDFGQITRSSLIRGRYILLDFEIKW